MSIAETMAGFAAGIDTRDWALYRSVFTEHIDVDYRSWRIESYGPMSADASVARGTKLFPGFDATQTQTLAADRVAELAERGGSTNVT